MAAINSIGQSEWSEHVGFYAAAAPGEVVNLSIALQSESQITV